MYDKGDQEDRDIAAQQTKEAEQRDAQVQEDDEGEDPTPASPAAAPEEATPGTSPHPPCTRPPMFLCTVAIPGSPWSDDTPFHDSIRHANLARV